MFVVPNDEIESLVIPLIEMTFESSVDMFKIEECFITEMSACVSISNVSVLLDASLSSRTKSE